MPEEHKRLEMPLLFEFVRKAEAKSKGRAERTCHLIRHCTEDGCGLGKQDSK
ncbi:MAG: hypothetical protein AB7S75_11205 [Desulfococcaceae bacterium]